MRVEIRAFSSAKAGNSDGQNDDRFHVTHHRGEEREVWFLGVADGATESIYAGAWASGLLDAPDWRRLFQPRRFPQDQVVRDWIRSATERVELRPTGEMPWYLRAKATRGSAATFLGVRLHQRRDPAGGRVTADIVAVGDCCVFRVQNGIVIGAFPVLAGADFGNSPETIQSGIGAAGPSIQRPVESWSFLRNDTLLLATDAVAHWIVRDPDDPAAPRANRLLTCVSNEGFARLIDRERELGLMRNDDATVVIATRRS